MFSDMPCDEKDVTSFVEALKRDLPDPRDNRGKRHSLALVVVGFVLATLMGRRKLSGVHRFILNRLDWLHGLTALPKGRPVSRAHLPRLLARLDWSALDRLIERCFGVRIQNQGGAWVAVDGKILRGALEGGEKQGLVMAVVHGTGEVVGQARQIGSKSSEVPVVRELLRETGLEGRKVSLDAHHCNPKTTAQIHQAGGVYLTQVKANQTVLLRRCRTVAQSGPALAETTGHDKGHGRVTTRRARLFPLPEAAPAPRWSRSGLSACVVVERETFEVATRKTTAETSYYISNQPIDKAAPQAAGAELAQAIRQHWGVESNNWIRDVTYNEDNIKTKSGNQAQVMGRLRGLAIELLRKTRANNLQAAIEKFVDSVPDLESMLRQVNFL
jgi:predicted transposase YbfD/YdcC